MELTFAPKNMLQIDNAKIVFRNFAGRGSNYNKEGDRNFAVIIDDTELVDALQNDLNRYGVGWNVKIKPPREEGDDPFMYLSVKVKFNDKGPKIWLVSGRNRRKLTEDTVGILDEIDIANVDLNIRPYDKEINGRAFRSAYLDSIVVTQDLNRFEERFASEEYPEE